MNKTHILTLQAITAKYLKYTILMNVFNKQKLPNTFSLMVMHFRNTLITVIMKKKTIQIKLQNGNCVKVKKE